MDSSTGVEGHGGAFEDDDDDNEGPLWNGAYVLVDSSVDPATCALTTTPFFAQFSEVEVYVYGDELDAFFDGGDFQSTYEISGSSLYDPTSPDDQDFDFADPAVSRTDFSFQSTFDCVLRLNTIWKGEIVFETEFVLLDEYRFTAVGGTECDLVATSSGFTALPCFDSQNTSWSL